MKLRSSSYKNVINFQAEEIQFLQMNKKLYLLGKKSVSFSGDVWTERSFCNCNLREHSEPLTALAHPRGCIFNPNNYWRVLYVLVVGIDDTTAGMS
jgi:hypothetical protein